MRLRRAVAPDPLELRLALRDERAAYLEHRCPAVEHLRLLGVSFTDGERAALRAGEEVAVILRCDRCIWERRVRFRLAAPS